MTVSVVVESNSVEQTMAVGQAIARAAQPGDIIALDGELGAGKTQLVRGMATALDIDPYQVASPTFVISHEYEPEDESLPVLVHVDAYRLTGPGDLDTIGWGEDGHELRDGAIVAIEWAERVADGLGDDLLNVHIEHTDIGRRLTLTPQGPWQQRDLQVMQDAPDKPKTKCSICGAAATDPAVFPFCSERCRKIDLGRWFDGRYLVSRPIEQADLEEGE